MSLTPEQTQNLLNVAIKNDQVEILDYLHRVEIYDILRRDSKAFVVAAKFRSFKCMDYLLEAGANIQVSVPPTNHFEYEIGIIDSDALNIALREFDMPTDPIIDYLSLKGFDFSKSKACIHTCARWHTVEVLDKLVEKGVSLENSGVIGFCIVHEKWDLAKALIERGVDFHEKQEYPLRIACGSGNLDMVRFLVSRGAQINVVPDEKEPDEYEPIGDVEGPLLSAMKNWDYKLVAYLVEQGADITIDDNSSIDYLLHYFEDYPGQKEIVELFLSKGLEGKAIKKVKNEKLTAVYEKIILDQSVQPVHDLFPTSSTNKKSKI